MRIDLSHLNGASSVAETKPKGKSAANSTSGVSAEDKATLTADATSVQSLKEQVASMPEVRMDRVSAVQQQLRAGTYKVDVDATADAIVRDWRK